MKLKYAVVIEKAPGNYAAYAPDVLGCVSVGDTWDEMLAMIREALEFHIELMLEDGDPLPKPRMSLRDAMRCHLSTLDEIDVEFYAEHGIEPDDWEETETSFIMLEIEVVEPSRSVAAAESGARMAAVGAASGRV